MESPKDTIKERLPIADVVGTYVKLTRAGKNLKACCPFHKERTPSFTVSPERGTYYCFGCGEKGDIFSFVEKMEGTDFKGALRILAERAGVALTPYRGESGPSKDEKERLYHIHEEAMRFFEDSLGKHADVALYLRGRGLTQETITKWHIGYARPEWRVLTDHLRSKGFTDAECVTAGLSIRPEKQGSDLYDRFRGRIMFPIGDAGGRVIAFSGRFFEKIPASPSPARPAGGGRPGGDDAKEGEPAKYVNSPETPLFHKSHVLYGLDRARGPMRRSDFAILVEGQMDLLMMHQSGFPNTLAASGTALTEEHLRLIGHTTKRLVLALDSDTAGVRSALRSSLLAFMQGFDVKIAGFPEGQDPADVGKSDPEALRTAIRMATSAVGFFIAHLRAHTKDERALRKGVRDEILPLIASMTSRMDQAHFIEVIARSIGLPEEDIRADMARVKVEKREGGSSSPGEASKEEPLPKWVHASALILLQGGDESRLKELIGEDRVGEAKEAAEKYKERLLFTLESEEYGAGGVEDLFETIKKEMLREDIEKVRREQHDAKAAGDEKRAEESARKLQELIRAQHGLPK